MIRSAIARIALTSMLVVTLPLSGSAQQPTQQQLQEALEAKQRIAQRLGSELARSDSSAEESGTAHAPAGAHAAARTGAAAHGTTATAAAHGVAAAAGHDSTRDVWTELLAGNRRFLAGKPRVRPLTEQRAALTQAQHPMAIVLGCSDSRVSPELLFDQSLGDLFVVRTAGNVADPVALGSMEYAVEHLHAGVLVVLGHGSCGAVKAALSSDDMPTPNLRALVDHIRPTVQRLQNCFEGSELVTRGVYANVRHSAAETLENSTLLREAVAQGHLKIVTAFYDLKTGEVTLVD